MSFADLEERSNTAVMRRLSNAGALVVGGGPDEIPVIFDRAHIDTESGASATVPLATAFDSAVSGFQAHVTQLQIRGVTYTVVDKQPDGTGLTVLVLEVA